MDLDDFTNSTVVSEHLVLDKVQIQQQQQELQHQQQQQQHQEQQQQQLHIFREEIYQPPLVSEVDSNYSEPKYYLGNYVIFFFFKISLFSKFWNN